MNYLTNEFLEELQKRVSKNFVLQRTNRFNTQINGNKIVVVDFPYYEEIIHNSCYFLNHVPSDTKKRTKQINITLSVCTHNHVYCNNNLNYLGIRYDLFDFNNHLFYKLKFSPYYFTQYNRVEMNLGVVINNAFDIYTLNKYEEHICKDFKLTSITNLSPSHLYMYVIDNKFFTQGLDKTHIGYNEDIKNLNEYATKINNVVSNLNLTFDCKGIACYNKKYKIKQVYEQTKHIQMPLVSSYYICH